MSEQIVRKLKSGFSPYLVTARHLDRWIPYQIYTAYSYCAEFVVLLAGAGLTSPLASAIYEKPVDSSANAQHQINLIDALLAQPFGIFSVIALIIWLATKLYIRQEELEKKCILLKSYMRQCLLLEAALHKALRETDPMQELVSLQAKLSDLVDRNIAEGSIPDIGINEKLRPKIEAYSEKLISDYSSNWEVNNDLERRPRPDKAHEEKENNQ